MKKRTALIGLWSCSALVFFWLLVAFLLTGGRDWSAFTEQDNYIILGAVIVEVLTVCALLFFTDQCAKANRQELPNPQLPKSGAGKLSYLRGVLSAVVAYVVALGIMLLGIKAAYEADRAALGAVWARLCGSGVRCHREFSAQQTLHRETLRTGRTVKAPVFCKKRRKGARTMRKVRHCRA